MGTGIKSRYLIVCLILVSLLLGSCIDRATTQTASRSSNPEKDRIAWPYDDQGVIKKADKQAREMMEQYNLHPVKMPEIASADKTERIIYNKWFFEILDNASKQVGLDLSKAKGKKLTMLSYHLNERCQSHEGTVTASFLCDGNGSLVGAFMSLAGYMPGVVGLNERHALYPDGLLRDKLSFVGISKIKIFGSHGENGWETAAILKEPEEIERFTSLLEKSIGHKGTFEVASIGQEEYRIALYYKDGPIIYASLAPRKPRDEMGIDVFQRWHYYPPKELKAYIVKLLQVEPEDAARQLVETYYKRLAAKDYKTARACLSAEYALQMDKFDDSDFKNLLSLSNIVVNKAANIELYGENYKELQVVAEYDAVYKRIATSGNGKQIRFIYVAKKTKDSPWRIISIGTGP